MRKLTVNQKSVYIVESHNQVLEAWESCPHQNVFSLDFHTDTREAFHNYSYWRADSEVKSGKYQNLEERKKELTDQKISQYLEKKISIKGVNDNLKHDEHMDFAVRTEMIETAFILSTNRNVTSSNPNVHIVCGSDKYRGQRIIEYSPSCIPACPKETHDQECRILRADSCLEDSFLEDALTRAESFKDSFFNNYILDLDCDYFNTEKSLYPEKMEIFRRLILNASLITIALEPACVKICRHEDCSLISDDILARLISIFESI